VIPKFFSCSAVSFSSAGAAVASSVAAVSVLLQPVKKRQKAKSKKQKAKGAKQNPRSFAFTTRTGRTVLLKRTALSILATNENKLRFPL
jgi:hypothetical protein